MGYHVHVLRTESGRTRPIAEDEVRQAVMPMAGRLEVMPGREPLLLYRPSLGDDSEIVAFDAGDGVLWADGPSDPLLELMIELAGRLGARVRGDEFETYRSLTDTYVHPDDRAAHEAARPPGRARGVAAPGSLARRVIVVVVLAVALTALLHLVRRLTRGG